MSGWKYASRALASGMVAIVAGYGLVACGVDVDQASTDLAELQKKVNELVEDTMPDSAAPSGPAEPAPVAAPGSAGPNASVLWQQLGAIEQKGRAPKTGYSRKQFGQRWSDDVSVEFGHNGCDTRNDILRRDLVDVSFKPNTRDCVVVSGILHDPYTGGVINFQRGQATSQAVQIDHVVALSDAWQKGAQQWDGEKRQNFANDPLNLLAVDGPANMQKGDGDAATWQPANKAFRCHYAARHIAVKFRYQLWATPAEHQALAKWLGTCTEADEGGLASVIT